MPRIHRTRPWIGPGEVRPSTVLQDLRARDARTLSRAESPERQRKRHIERALEAQLERWIRRTASG